MSESGLEEANRKRVDGCGDLEAGARLTKRRRPGQLGQNEQAVARDKGRSVWGSTVRAPRA